MGNVEEKMHVDKLAGAERVKIVLLKGNSTKNQDWFFEQAVIFAFQNGVAFLYTGTSTEDIGVRTSKNLKLVSSPFLQLSRGSELTSGLSPDVKLSYAGGLFEQNNMENRGRVVVL